MIDQNIEILNKTLTLGYNTSYIWTDRLGYSQLCILWNYSTDYQPTFIFGDNVYSVFMVSIFGLPFQNKTIVVCWYISNSNWYSGIILRLT